MHSGNLTALQRVHRLLEGMGSIGYTFWQDGDNWLGHLDEYPDFTTQGTSIEDLKEHLLDLYQDLSNGLIPLHC